MPDVMGAFCVLGIVLAVVAVIGHGIWVVARTVIRAIAGQSSQAASASRSRCPRCESPWEGTRENCLICDWPGPLALPHATARAYRQLREQLNDWQRAGVLSQQACQALIQTIDEEAARIAQPAAPVVPAAPVAPPAPVVRPMLPPLPLSEGPVSQAPTPAPLRPETMAEKLRHMTERPATEEVEVAVVAEVVESGDRPASASWPAPWTAPPPVPAAPPRRSFGEVFVSFMEEKNIRWGELVGGLLIVCCSIALVISFWTAIAERPVLKYIVFNGVTSALFGVAFYTERRWKLPNTSRGLYIIASLLVPLNFLAMAAFSTAQAAPLPLTIVGEAISLALFGVLLWLASRSLAPEFTRVLAPAVTASALAELLVRHFIVPNPELPILLAIGALPVVAMLGTALAIRVRSYQWEPVAEAHCHQLFRLLGLVTFAGLAAAGLLIARAGASRETLEHLSPLIALYACGPLAVGMLLWRRLRASDLTGMRIAGTAIAVAGVMLMLLAVAFAWPQPAMMLVVLSVEAVVLLAVARVSGIPAAVLPGSLCASAAYLIAWLGFSKELPWTIKSPQEFLQPFLDATTGSILVGAAAVCGAATAWRALRGDRETARYFGAAAGINAVLSLALVTFFGFGKQLDAEHVTWVYAVYGVAALVAGRWALPHVLAAAGSLLLLTATVQGVVFGQIGHFDHPWLMALLWNATAFTLLRVLAEAWPKLAGEAWRETVAVVAAAVNSFALLFALALLIGLPAGEVAVYLAWISGLWLTLAYLMRSQELFGVFQVSATFALLAAVTGQLQHQPWYQASRLPLLDPRSWQAWGIALAASFLVWKAFHFAFQRSSTATEGSETPALPNDTTGRHRISDLLAASPLVGRFALGMSVLMLFGMSIYAVVPGAAQELTPHSLALQLTDAPPATATRVVPPASAFELLGVPHVHAAGLGAWGLFAIVVVALLTELRERFTRTRLVLLLSVASLACLLVSARFEVDVAAASALRWTTAIGLLAISAMIWMRVPLGRFLERRGWQFDDTPREKLGGDAWATSLVDLLLPMLAMGVFIAGAALWQRPPEAAMQMWFVGLLAVFAVAGAVGVVLMRLETTGGATMQRTWAGDIGRLVTILGAMPLVVVVLYVVSSSLRGNPIVGPEPGSLFHQMGLAGSYAAPLALITITLLGHAIRERSSSFALSAGLMLNLCATAGYLLYPWPGGVTLNAELWVQLAQLNAAVAAVYAILWRIAVMLFERRRGADRVTHDSCLAAQSAIGLVLLAIVFIPAAFSFWWEASLLTVHFQIGSAAGWWSLGLAVAAALLNLRAEHLEPEASAPGATRSILQRVLSSVPILAAAAWGLSVMATFSVGRVTLDDWRAFHTLLGAHIASAAALLALGIMAARPSIDARRAALCVIPWALLFTFLTCAVSIRGTLEDQNRPGWWWSVVGLSASAALLAFTAAFAERRRYLYFAAACVNLAAIALYASPANQLLNSGDVTEITHFAWTNVMALALPVTLWLWIDRRFIEPNRLERRKPATFGVHRFASAAAILLFAGTVALGIFATLVDRSIVTDEWLGWLALAATFVAALACLWDPKVKGGTLSLYLLGIIGIGFAIDRFQLPFKWLLFNGAAIAAAYAIATSYLWSRREGLVLLARRLKMPVDAHSAWRSAAWLVPANCLLMTAVLALTTLIVLTFDDATLRLLAAKAAWFQVVALLFLTRGAAQNGLRHAALALGVVGAALWGWAWLSPIDGPQILDRGVIVMAVLAASGVLYGFGLTKFFKTENPWTQVGQQTTPLCIGGALVALAMILGGEVFAFMNSGSVDISHWAEAVVGASLIGLAVAAIVAAIVPGRDPLGLSERGRQAYVYGAEILLAATFVHVRICLPELFGERFQQYWPLIVMAIAFLGVGLSEWFRRRRQMVLAEPLERTGALLPLLPVLGFFAIDSGTHYSVLLMVVGTLYAALSVLRKSFGFGVMAALAANGGLWYFLHHDTAIGLLEHPQVWLIPPAICVLAATYLNRERLTKSQMTQLRYISAMTIYVSSTADIFLNGMQNSPWLAFVLAGLAILGVLAGILLRIRAFLYLGTSFLCLALLTMIYHAAHDLHQTWVWYASGIVLGAIIIAGFAVMEKKRTEFQHALGRLREWEA